MKNDKSTKTTKSSAAPKGKAHPKSLPTKTTGKIAAGRMARAVLVDAIKGNAEKKPSKKKSSIKLTGENEKPKLPPASTSAKLKPTPMKPGRGSAAPLPKIEVGECYFTRRPSQAEQDEYLKQNGEETTRRWLGACEEAFIKAPSRQEEIVHVPPTPIPAPAPAPIVPAALKAGDLVLMDGTRLATIVSILPPMGPDNGLTPIECVIRAQGEAQDWTIRVDRLTLSPAGLTIKKKRYESKTDPGSNYHNCVRSTVEKPISVVKRICLANAGKPRKEILALCVAAGVNPSTAATQFSIWKVK